MTIPSLGGNGHEFHPQPKTYPTQPANETVVHSAQIPETNQVEQTQMQQPIPNTQPQGGQQTVATVEPTGEKEYSIEQFQKDYATLVETKVMPILSEFEKERKQRLTWAIIGAIVFVILGLGVFFCINSRESGKLAAALFGAAFGVWAWIKKSFEHKVKRLIMPTLMHAVPGFYWQETPPVTAKDISDCMIFPFANASKTFDDCFLGEYRKVKVAMSECQYSVNSGNNSRTVFQGIVIRFSMNKNFEGTTIIRPKESCCSDNYKDLKKAKLSEVKLEDPEFAKKYVVYSTDQVEARYLITTSFMERFKMIENAFASEFAYCSFKGKSIYIAPHTGTDLFNLCSLVKPIGNSEQFETLFYEFASILELVDYFKLDKKLGL